MTETYKAGEHVKLVASDAAYNYKLGDQTGLVGTVVTEGRNVYVTFPHTGDERYYYLHDEVVRAPGTTPLPEPLKTGDWVKVTGYDSGYWDDTVGQIELIEGTKASIKQPNRLFPLAFPLNNLEVTEAPKPAYKEGDRVELIENYGRNSVGDAGTITKIEDGETGEGDLFTIALDAGRTVATFAKRFKHTTKPKPIPAAKFAVGDWVKVTGYNSSTWEGVKGKVTLVGVYSALDGYTYVIETPESKPYQSGGFEEKYLQLTTAPYVPQFKVGDWVEVNGCCNYNCNGTVWQVETVPTGESVGNYYKLKSEQRGTRANYGERYLEATTEPWAPKFKAGDWVEITGWGGGFNGEKLKVTEVPATEGGYYKFENKASGYGFSERHLKATEAPHWTETEPIHSAVRIGGRTIVKIAADKWLFLYHDGSYSEKLESVTTRNNKETRDVFCSEKPKYAFTTPK